MARAFSPCDQVLALLPIPGSPFGAKYSGPFTVLRKISERNYVVSTPKRRRKKQHSHVNLLKPYYSSPLLVMGDRTVASPVTAVKRSPSYRLAPSFADGHSGLTLKGWLQPGSSIVTLFCVTLHYTDMHYTFCFSITDYGCI